MLEDNQDDVATSTSKDSLGRVQNVTAHPQRASLPVIIYCSLLQAPTTNGIMIATAAVLATN